MPSTMPSSTLGAMTVGSARGGAPPARAFSARRSTVRSHDQRPVLRQARSSCDVARITRALGCLALHLGAQTPALAQPAGEAGFVGQI